MNVVSIIAGILLIISCVLVIVVITLQNKSSNGLAGAIMGGSSNGIGANSETDTKMLKLTKILAAVFFVLTLVTSFICMAAK